MYVWGKCSMNKPVNQGQGVSHLHEEWNNRMCLMRLKDGHSRWFVSSWGYSERMKHTLRTSRTTAADVPTPATMA